MVDIEVINPGTPVAGPYSPGVKVGNLLFVSGQVSKPGTTDIKEQTRSVLDNIKKIVEAYAAGVNKYERIGEWIDRIGWERFFEKADIEFTHQHIDDYRLAMTTWRTTTNFKW